VLVVDGGGSLRVALDRRPHRRLALASGWAGLVINGCVRDVAALRELELGVAALGSTPRPSDKAGAGEVDVPVAFGAVTFRPGAWLAADEDGIVLLDDAWAAQARLGRRVVSRVAIRPRQNGQDGGTDERSEMLTLTDGAKEVVRRMVEAELPQGRWACGSGPSPSTRTESELALDVVPAPEQGDQVVESDGARVSPRADRGLPLD
jgi:hypothetical protein